MRLFNQVFFIAVAIFISRSLLVADAMQTTEAAKVVECHIDASLSSDGLRLSAAAAAHSAVSGDFKFSITKKSAAGVTQTAQSGKFQLSKGETKILATTILERSADGHYNATLELKWDDERMSCVTPSTGNPINL